MAGEGPAGFPVVGWKGRVRPARGLGPKASLEALVVAHGGTKVQNPTERTAVLLAGDRPAVRVCDCARSPPPHLSPRWEYCDLVWWEGGGESVCFTLMVLIFKPRRWVHTKGFAAALGHYPDMHNHAASYKVDIEHISRVEGLLQIYWHLAMCLYLPSEGRDMSKAFFHRRLPQWR